MVLSADMRALLGDELQQLEDDSRALVRRVLRALGGDQREKQRVASAKIDLLIGTLSDLIYANPDDPDAAIDEEIASVQRTVDEMIVMQAELDRRTRGVHRRGERLDLAERRLHVRHLGEELDAERGRLSR